MRAYQLPKGGAGIDALTPVERPKPSPGHRQVLVKVAACSLNFRDLGIVRGTYQPGSLLPREAALMAAFDASRTSLREAIKVLSAKGLVETRQKVGTRVRELPGTVVKQS